MMWRPAIVRFGMLASIFAVACGGASKGRSGGGETIGNRGPIVARDADMTASYWCSITSGEYAYPAMPCVIRKVNDQFMLAKLAGSQRFRGVVRPRGDGFTFDGEFYCPFGDCTQPLHGVFAPTTDGKLRGTFDDKSIIVTMTRTQDNGGWGGSGYGGSTYGEPLSPQH